MESKANYTIVGLFVLVFVIGLLWAVLWLSVGFDKKSYKTYQVDMNEPVSGLSVQAPVKYNGVSVGYVESIALNHQDPQQVRLLLAIEQGTPVTTSTTAKLYSQGITGLTYIGLTAESAHAELLNAKPGQKYPTIPSRPSLLLQLDTALRDATDNFREITRSFKQVFDRENAKYLKDSLNQLDVFTKVLARHNKDISQTLTNANQLMKNAASASEDLPAILAELKKGSKSFAVAARAVTEAGQQVRKTMLDSSQTIKIFNDDILPPTTDLLDELEITVSDINQLTRELKQNPSVLIRGRTPLPLGPGEY